MNFVLPTIEQKKDSTDEFILLSILSIASKNNYSLERLQLMKILRNVKERVQQELGFEAYHKEFVREKHGDFTGDFYAQMSNLKQADFITSKGVEPYEKFSTTLKGDEIFERVRLNSGVDNLKLNKVKKLVEQVVVQDAPKSSGQLRVENHERIVEYNGVYVPLEDVPVGQNVVTTANLKNGDCFIFDENATLDWGLYRKIAKRNREQLLPDEEIPQSQEEAYSIIGL